MKTETIGTDKPDSRRGFLRAAGALGVATAAATMLPKTTASAHSAHGCCYLAPGSNHSGVNWCLFNGEYVWYCNNSGGGQCTCCEAYWTNISASNC